MNTQFNESTNQNSLKPPKLLSQLIIIKRYHKTFGPRIINSPLSHPPFSMHLLRYILNLRFAVYIIKKNNGRGVRCCLGTLSEITYLTYLILAGPCTTPFRYSNSILSPLAANSVAGPVNLLSLKIKYKYNRLVSKKNSSLLHNASIKMWM